MSDGTHPGLLLSTVGEPEEGLVVEATMSRGLDGRYHGNQGAACERAASDFGTDSCVGLRGVREGARQKLSVESPAIVLFSTKFFDLFDLSTASPCYFEEEFNADGVHDDALNGWYTGLIYGISGELEFGPYRFIESVNNDDVCPVLRCDDLEVVPRACHVVQHTMGMPQLDGTIEFVEAPPRLWRPDDELRPVLPDLVPILTDVQDGTSVGGMITECARSETATIANSGAPLVQGVRLRFDSAFANLGHGPLHVRPEGGVPPASSDDTWAIEQVVYDAIDPSRTWRVESDGAMVHHPSHNHFHLTQIYQTSVSDPERPELGRQHVRKLGFCIEATARASSPRYNADNYPVSQTFDRLYGRLFEDVRVDRLLDDGTVVQHSLGVSGCQLESFVDVYEQGLLPGWVDEYARELAGQSVDLLGFPGAERLQFDVVLDPLNQITELSESNNAATYDVYVGGLDIPWAALDYQADGSVDLLGSNTQGALDEWCAMREAGGGSAALEHNRISCDPPSAFLENDDSGRDSCFDYASCEVLGAMSCVQDQSERWLLAECIDAEGALRRVLPGPCGSGTEFTCDATGNVTPCP